jgi:hypothetical protein
VNLVSLEYVISKLENLIYNDFKYRELNFLTQNVGLLKMIILYQPIFLTEVQNIGDASVSSKVLVRKHQLSSSNGTNFAHPDIQYPSYMFMKASQKFGIYHQHHQT